MLQQGNQMLRDLLDGKLSQHKANVFVHAKASGFTDRANQQRYRLFRWVCLKQLKHFDESVRLRCSNHCIARHRLMLAKILEGLCVRHVGSNV